MKNLISKLESKAGESLIETLAAILIFAMASIIMYTMVTTAGDLNLKTKEMDEANQQHMIAVEKGLTSDKNGTPIITVSDATITFSIGTNTIAQVDVNIYGGQNGSLYAYYQTPPEDGNSEEGHP